MATVFLTRILNHTFATRKRNLYKLITGEHTRKLDETTLTGRILLYFDPNISDQMKRVNNDHVTIIHRIKKENDWNLAKKSTEEMRNLLLLSNSPKLVRSKLEFLRVFGKIDSEYCVRLGGMENKDIMDVLRLYMQIIPNRLIESRFYNAAVNTLENRLEEMTKTELLQFMFFVGLQKKTKGAKKMMHKCMGKLSHFNEELNVEELCVICNSTFKTSTKIKNIKFLEKVKDFINENLHVLKDPAVFITLIKTVRHNQCQDDNLLSTISCTVFFNKTLQYYSFPAMCHILALYSDYMYYDENILKHFTTKCIEQLKQMEIADKRTYFTEHIRDKDLKRFLWSLSRLGYNLDTDLIRTEVIPNIMERIQKADLLNDPPSMCDIVLYLWVMNYQAQELIPYALNQQNIDFIYRTNQFKRLNLLLTAIYFENQPLFKELGIRIKGGPTLNKEEQLNSRPTLKRVYDNLKVILPKTELNKFDITSQVPHLDILGITGFKRNIYKAVHVEVLDDVTSLKNSESLPSGIMKMKLRILDGSEEGLVVVSVLIILR